MSVLQLMADAPKIRADRRAQKQAMTDRTYKRTPIGGEVWRYIRALRWSDAAASTIEAYEYVLATFALDYASDDLESFAAPTAVDELREFLNDHWGDASTATKAQRTYIIRAFFKWAAEEGRISYNPTLTLKSVRVKNKVRVPHERHTLRRLVAAQDSLRDQVGLQLVGRLALRKNDLRLLQIRDVDLTRDFIVLKHSKGGGEDLIPIVLEELRQDLYLHIVGEGRQGDEFLLYPKNHRLRPLDASNLHRWFKRCLERADLLPFPMHELRHTAADELWRVTGNMMLAKQLLRHESVSTTERYLHPTDEDLRAGLKAVDAAWRDE